ncbi:hypothetical protein F6455_00780 [Proteobacteria bacterium 005FR1]|nr:hypothetical protein [Proteobacteria bacterium 005FR1]
MSTPLYDITSLQAALERGEVVLTPNQRLRNRIREAFAATQGAVSRTPPVYSLAEWLEQSWNRLQVCEAETDPVNAGPVVANELQMQLIWKQTIESDGGEQPLFVSKRLVQQAMEARRNLDLWQLPLERVTAFGGVEDYPLPGWARSVESRLEALGLISREQSYRRLLAAFETGALPRLPVIHTERLGELPPLIQSLLETASDQLHVVESPARKSRGLRFAADSFEEEIRTAACWAHRHLQQNSQATVGIIVPDLGTRRDLVERLFCETFEAGFYSPDQPRYTLPFNISTGTPLAQAPVIAAALQLLQLGESGLEAKQLRKILNSPFWSESDEELPIRAALLETLEKKGQLRFSAAQLRSTAQKLAEQDNGDAARAFSRRLQTVGSERRRLSGAATPGIWVERILTILDGYGWPGGRTLDSVEYQQVRQFYSLLEQFASLDALQKNLPAGEATSLLAQLAHATPFQAEVRHSPVQILGSLEADGLQFDACWVIGMTSQAWPPNPEPNPLLPIPLQRQYRMPRSSVEREVKFASALTEHYKCCADSVIFSHAVQMDEAQMLPSSLIADLPPATRTEILDAPDVAAVGLPSLYSRLESQRHLQLIECSHGPAFEAEPGTPVRGGTGILQQQARCPFDAFATYRLGARQPIEATLGLSPADKGSAVHGVMAKIWEILKDQETLTREAANIESLVEKAVDAVFADLSNAALELGDRYLQLEKARVNQLATEMLRRDLKREPFRVPGIEEGLQAEFAGLTFRLRMDRIDQTAAGHWLMIDYKTGNSVNVNQWLGERPDEPQLPLYALCYPEPISGISFACVRTAEPGYCGIVADEVAGWDKRIKTPEQLKDPDCTDWPTLMATFKRNLTALATEYREGYAAVAPKSPTAVRYSTHLLPLNRLGEADFITFYLDQHLAS